MAEPRLDRAVEAWIKARRAREDGPSLSPLISSERIHPTIAAHLGWKTPRFASDPDEHLRRWGNVSKDPIYKALDRMYADGKRTLPERDKYGRLARLRTEEILTTPADDYERQTKALLEDFGKVQH
jgi:hypothetical protein